MLRAHIVPVLSPPAVCREALGDAGKPVCRDAPRAQEHLPGCWVARAQPPTQLDGSYGLRPGCGKECFTPGMGYSQETRLT